MTNIHEIEPWRALPADVADVIEPELSATSTEILATIAREVPSYARPFEGSFGSGVRTGVSEALRQFVALIRDPEGGREREVYVALGRGELRNGRTLDALQAAYRVGARVAWRCLSGAARREGVDPEVLSLLAEAIFAYIDQLSADSVEGYARARAEVEGQRQRRRGELVALLLREPPPQAADVRSAAEAAGWPLPRTAAALALEAPDLERVARRLPSDAIATVLDGTGCALIPDARAPGRSGEIEKATEGIAAAIGPAAVLGPAEAAGPAATPGRTASAGSAALIARHAVDGPTAALGQTGALGPSATGELDRGLVELRESWSLARAALRGLASGALAASGLVHAEQRLLDVLVFQNRALLDRIAAQRLAPLAELTPKARRRMEETALAYVQHGGNAAAMARAMGVHPQTARYRLARLRETLGEGLDNPDGRFELELALRGRAGALGG
ncbi:MAG: PucR family transcriptional regulator [Solirubrobacteraceae bacterium]